MAIEAVIFDAEGVVVDSERIWDYGQEVFLARRGLRYDRGRLKPMLTGQSLRDGTRVLERECGLEGDTDKLAAERMEIVRHLFATDVGFVPGFREFFERVRARYRTCLATAMPPDLLALADERLGLTRLFGGQIFTLDDVDQRSKPDPAIFLFASSRLGVDPRACVVIEDAPHGVEAARRAGMLCIGITTTYEPENLAAADLVVSSFDEIDLSALEPRTPTQ